MKTCVISFFVILCTLDVTSTITIFPSSEDNENICCLPTLWEAMLYLDYGTVFIDSNTAFAYINGSVHAAFSFPKKKVYFRINGFELSPLIPKPEPYNTVLLYDFENMQMYNVDGTGECMKSALENNMTEQCIPRHAKHIATGLFGSGDTVRVTQTYKFSTDIVTPYDIIATVYKNDIKPIEPKICEPIYVHYFAPTMNPDSGSAYGLQFLDLGPIKSDDIFDIPQACQHL